MLELLSGEGERVLEVGRLRRGRQSGKSDALDAIRAARSLLGQTRPARPRAGGEREALRALSAAREAAVTARRAGLCQLRGLLVSAPEPLRAELRSLTRAQLLRRLAAARPERRQDPELRGTLLPLRALARRVKALTVEERELQAEIETLTRKLARQLFDQPGVGPLARLDRSGDQAQPDAAHDPGDQTPSASADDRLHRASDPGRQEPPRSKTLPKRYLARNLYRLLEHGAPLAT